MSELDRRLARIAEKQHQLLTIGDVREAGGTIYHATARVEGGRWRRVDRGVFLIEGAPFSWPVRMHAAVLAAGPGAVASHLAAARLWGLSGFDRAGAELSIPRGRRYRRADVRTHESTDLDRCSVVLRDGVPVTDPARTILDVARYVGVKRLARIVEGSRRAHLVTWSTMISCLLAHARRGRPGIRRLRTVILEGAHRDEVTDTDMEHLVLGLILEAGLPEPTVHHRVTVDGRFIGEVDLAYPDLQIAIECDGDVHLDPAVRERDLARQNDLILEGWTVLRYSWTRVQTRPGVVASEVRAAIRSARHAQSAADTRGLSA